MSIYKNKENMKMQKATFIRRAMHIGLALSLMACSISVPGSNGTESLVIMPPLVGGIASLLPINNSAIEAAVIRYTNEERAKAGLSAVKANSTLSALAQRHSKDMLTRGYFEHEDLEGRGPTERLKLYYPGTLSTASENIAKIPRALQLGDDAHGKALVKGWMNSPGHRENLLFPSHKFLGVGVAADSTYLYGTQNFS